MLNITVILLGISCLLCAKNCYDLSVRLKKVENDLDKIMDKEVLKVIINSMLEDSE